MIFRPVKNAHIIDHEKSMNFPVSDHEFSRLGLNSHGERKADRWHHQDPRNKKFLTLELSAYCRVNRNFYHQIRSVV